MCKSTLLQPAERRLHVKRECAQFSTDIQHEQLPSRFGEPDATCSNAASCPAANVALMDVLRQSAFACTQARLSVT